MARLLALEWDAREARVAVATRRGRDAVIEQAFAIDLLPGKDGGEVNIGERLRTALAARGLGKVETLVAVGRANIELRVLNVPAAPDEELPDMVRFQAMRQFASIGEDWALDFVPLDRSSDGGQSVLAAAISPELIKQIKSTCTAATLEPQRLVLRPFAAASLLRRRTQDPRCRLMVDVLTDEADLTVLSDGHVVFLRTVRLPAAHDGAESWRPLLNEIRRTISAAQSQLGKRRVEVVTLCGEESDHRELKTALTQQLGIEVESFNPFSQPAANKQESGGESELPLSMSGSLSLTREALQAFPENPGRFAPLLGMLAVEVAGDRHAIDFLHPRKRPPPASNRRKYLVIGGGVAAVLLVGGAMLMMSLSSLDSQIAALKKESLGMDAEVKAGALLEADVEKIDEFVMGDITWLEKLAKLSRDFPPAEDVVLTQVTMSVRSGGGGQASLDGAAKQSSTVGALERKLREKGNRISPGGTNFDERQTDYKWLFSESITLPPVDVTGEEESDAAPAGGSAPSAAKPAGAARPAASPAPAKPSAAKPSTGNGQGGAR